ncbi:hypothetical protein AVEN_200098-1 [Araneus ventricosus]|uniref:Uncharacterized protein n=1 Tax=Araneus ventricosus TaxID=182803 RepID=A0A4Y2JUK2_ARAVE|nr:hypothetical protein AVEN_200098-1 [Araneus ventricosus]
MYWGYFTLNRAKTPNFLQLVWSSRLQRGAQASLSSCDRGSKLRAKYYSANKQFTTASQNNPNVSCERDDIMTKLKPNSNIQGAHLSKGHPLLTSER